MSFVQMKTLNLQAALSSEKENETDLGLVEKILVTVYISVCNIFMGIID
jgi:hypothetical protein